MQGKGPVLSDTIWVPRLDPPPGQAKFQALALAIRQAVRDGALPAGARLPAVRDLAWRLKVTPGTVARAYQLAARDGLIESHVGRGSFVRARPDPALQPMLTVRTADAMRDDGPVDLRLPQLPDVGQVAAIRAAMRAAADTLGPELLDYPGPASDLACRKALLGWLADRPLGDIGADDLALTMGGQGAMGMVMQLVLRDHRPAVLAEALGYPGLRHAARLARGRMVPVALDERGMIPAALDAAAGDGLAGLVCVTPSAQNPTAARMDRVRREEIVAVARRHDLQILEDECIWNPAGPDPLPGLRALAPERTWTVTSLSKTLSAALRVGALVCPAGMGQPARLAVQHAHFGLPLPVTAMVTHLLDSGAAARLGAQVQAIFDERVAAAAAALAGTDVVWRPGAPHLWLRLPRGWRGSTFVRAAAAQGVLVRSADEFAPLHCEGGAAGAGPQVPNAVRLAVACQIARPRFDWAIATLRRLHDAPPAEVMV